MIDSTGNNSDTGATGEQQDRSGQLPNPDRRRFSGRALAGGAVLASIGNRSAWGQTVVGCMSVTTIASFNPGTGVFISAPGGRPENDEALAAEIHQVAGPFEEGYFATAVGTDGVTVYSTCQDPVELDGVCLVEGPACPP